MSLLLAALKKSGEDEAGKRGLAELQLEVIPKSASSQLVTQVDPLSAPDTNPSASTPPSGINKISPARSESKNLFSAKKFAPIKRLRLGIVPIILIGGGILAVAGSLYVYHQITGLSRSALPIQTIFAPIAISPGTVTTTALLSLVPTAKVEPANVVTEEPPSHCQLQKS